MDEVTFTGTPVYPTVVQDGPDMVLALNEAIEAAAGAGLTVELDTQLESTLTSAKMRPRV